MDDISININKLNNGDDREIAIFLEQNRHSAMWYLAQEYDLDTRDRLSLDKIVQSFSSASEKFIKELKRPDGKSFKNVESARYFLIERTSFYLAKNCYEKLIKRFLPDASTPLQLSNFKSFIEDFSHAIDIDADSLFVWLIEKLCEKGFRDRDLKIFLLRFFAGLDKEHTKAIIGNDIFVDISLHIFERRILNRLIVKLTLHMEDVLIANVKDQQYENNLIKSIDKKQGGIQ